MEVDQHLAAAGSPCIDTPTGIDKLSPKPIFKISPNPVTDLIEINRDEEFEYLIIYNSTGKIVKKRSYEKTISVKELSPGIYFIYFRFADGTYQISNFIKQ